MKDGRYRGGGDRLYGWGIKTTEKGRTKGRLRKQGKVKVTIGSVEQNQENPRHKKITSQNVGHSKQMLIAGKRNRCEGHKVWTLKPNPSRYHTETKVVRGLG